MTPEHLIRAKGSAVTIKRPAKTRDAADGSTKTGPWSTVATGVPLLVQPISERARLKDFGREVEGEYAGFAIAGTDVQIDDGIIVTAKDYAGLHFRVTAAPERLSGPKHRPLALALTTESFS